MLPDLQNQLSSLPVLNPEQMAILREEGLVETLTELFREMAGGTMDAMAVALETGDMRELSSKAHLLKGSAVNFGADRLVAVCQKIEHSATSLDKVTLEKLLDAVRAQYQLVNEALDLA